jgi:ribosomal protein L31
LNKGSKESWHAIYDGKDLMVKMGKLVQKFKNRFFRNEFPEKIVKHITSPKTP